MLRQFTISIGRYSKGAKHDYPKDTWGKLALDAGMPLDKFTVEIDENPVHQSALKGRVRVHKRLGATQ